MVNFGPLNILPNIKPPTSEAIQPASRIKSKIFTPSKIENKKNILQKIKIYNPKEILHKNLDNLDIKIFDIIFVNSKNAKD